MKNKSNKVSTCFFVCLLVCWFVGLLVDWLVGWLVCLFVCLCTFSFMTLCLRNSLNKLTAGTKGLCVIYIFEKKFCFKLVLNLKSATCLQNNFSLMNLHMKRCLYLFSCSTSMYFNLIAFIKKKCFILLFLFLQGIFPQNFICLQEARTENSGWINKLILILS